MKKDLLHQGAHLPELSTQLRSTQEIFACVSGVSSFPTTHAHNQITQHVPRLKEKANVRSMPPLYIPMLYENYKHHFTEALQISIQRIKKQNHDKFLCAVILHNSRQLPAALIQKSLIDSGVEQEQIIIHPQKAKGDTIDELETFLGDPKGFYVVPDSNYDGMEARAVIYCLDNDFDDCHVDSLNAMHPNNITSIRCHLSRAVSELCVIHPFEVNSYRYENTFLFNSVEIDTRFMSCTKEMKYWAFICQSDHLSSDSASTAPVLKDDPVLSEEEVKDKLICPSCIICCHWNHKNRKGVKLGGSPYSSKEDRDRMVAVDLNRRKSCSVSGETQCSCHLSRECKLVRRNRCISRTYSAH